MPYLDPYRERNDVPPVPDPTPTWIIIIMIAAVIGLVWFLITQI